MVRIYKISVPLFFALSSLLLTSCGDENNITEYSGMSVLESGEKIPDCTKDNEGAMFYVEDSSAVFYCASGKWKTLNGKDGADGKDGENGKPGDDGKNGTSSKDTVVVNYRDTLVVRDTLTINKVDSVVIRDSVTLFDTAYVYDTTRIYDTTYVYDTTTVLWSPDYDTVTTEFLNQEMLAEGKYGFFVDSRDNHVYRTIKIGNQIWMAQNLNYNADGVMSFCYANSQEYCDKYGRLYYWAGANGLDESYNQNRATRAKAPADSILHYPNRGICPEGWHVPDSSEWNKLNDWVAASNMINYDNEGVGRSLKSSSDQIVFLEGSGSVGTDRYGFSATPTGRIWDGVYKEIEYWGLWWSSSETSAKIAVGRNVHYDNDLLGLRSDVNKLDSRAVRCLQD